MFDIYTGNTFSPRPSALRYGTHSAFDCFLTGRAWGVEGAESWYGRYSAPQRSLVFRPNISRRVRLFIHVVVGLTDAGSSPLHLRVRVIPREFRRPISVRTDNIIARSRCTRCTYVHSPRTDRRSPREFREPVVAPV